MTIKLEWSNLSEKVILPNNPKKPTSVSDRVKKNNKIDNNAYFMLVLCTLNLCITS